MSIQDNLHRIASNLPEGVTLVAVSKTKPVSDLLTAYQAGQRIFGENRIQEMTEKHAALPKDIQWHMIGHVQSNKVRHMIPYVALIHGVDSLKLLQEIDRQARRAQRTVDCLLQVHIAEEESKFGLSAAELDQLLQSAAFAAMENIRIRGLMGMATFTEDQGQVEKEFRSLKSIFDNTREKTGFPHFDILSMGMSGDYDIAIGCGSTMVRIGSLIFGER